MERIVGLLIFMALMLGATLAAWLWWHNRAALPPLAAVPANAPPLDPPGKGLHVFHLGHSLVGRDMPAMLQQLAHAAGFPDHIHASQLGWGTPLRAHWEEDIEITGFAEENAHARFRPAHEAIASGTHDAVILTEMVELRDALRWHDGAAYFHRWAQAARQARPDVRLYLYETWHDLEHPEGWLNRLDADPAALWEGRLLAPSWADPALGGVHVIPAGRVLAALARALETEGAVAGLDGPHALFARNSDGTPDTIHLNDQGQYLVALTHMAVLYQRPVTGLPHRLMRADGTPAAPPSPEAAALMKRVVWEVVRSLPVTGIPRMATTGD
ncbi:MAG: hypothetical protein ACK4LQ_05310 [Pararhodobacter sp.]